MKRLLYSSALVLSIMLGACHKQVTDIAPQDLLSSELAFSSASKVQSAVIATYDRLQDDANSNYFLSGRALIYVDLMGEDIFDRTSYFGDLPKFNMLANNSLPASVWTAGYAAIARANAVIVGVDGAVSGGIITEDQGKAYVAECKFVRAISHFYLVNFFGQPYAYTADASHAGVPIITESFTSNDPAANKARNTVAEVYTQVITDLTDALADLPSDYSDTDDPLLNAKSRATKAAAASLLSRVYLYKGDYPNAKLYAGQVIDGDYGSFVLNTTVGGAFGPGNYETDETVFSIANSNTDNPNTNASLPMHYYPNGRADLPISSSFTSTTTNPYFATDDLRRGLIIPGVAATATTQYVFTNKYPDYETRADWAPIIRYPELLLTYAEAATRVSASVDADAIDKLNQVRDRARVSAAQYTTASFTSSTDLINAILGERRIELAFEGHRFWDLMRIKANVTNKYDSDGTTLLPTENYGAQKNVFPIPQTEIQKSGGVLKQNDGY